MVVGCLGRLAPVRVTVAYAVIVSAVTSVLLWQGPRFRDRVICHASTNLHNLSHGRLGTLVGSAFVVDAGPIFVWLPGLICLLALAELLWGSTRLLTVFAAGHIGATLLVAAVLAAGVIQEWLPGSVIRAPDVGMSYGAAAVLGSLTAALPARCRPAWVGWWVAIGLTTVAVERGFSDVGHAVALGVGMLASTRFTRAGRWTAVRWLLLGVAAAFGYALLVTSGPPEMIATACGLAAAASGAAVAHARRRCAFEGQLAHRL